MLDNQLAQRIADRIRREGPITFADYMDAALYDAADGFFATGGGAGRAGRDFVTSPEVGQLFGALIARAIDDAWRRLGEPDPFQVVEVGAGRGRLAADVLGASPVCAPALRYVLVERSESLRVQQRELLTLEPPDEALGPFVRSADPDEAPTPALGRGPIFTSLGELPAIDLHVGVIVANELLDNLPIRIVEWSEGGWTEVRVGLDAHDGFAEVKVAASPDLTSEADAVAADAARPDGARLPVPIGIRDWLATVGARLRRGEVLLLDYADDAAGLIRRGPEQWLRTYRAHVRGDDPLVAPGSQDITCDVPLEYLRTAAHHVGFSVSLDTDQAAWLRSLGIDAFVDEARATWSERAAIGDLPAIAARSRVVEAEALLDDHGLGAHRVVVLHTGLMGEYHA